MVGGMVTVVRDGRLSVWRDGTGWVVDADPEKVANPAAAYHELPIGPPHVAWGTEPGHVEVTIDHMREKEAIEYDWVRGLRVRERWLTTAGALEREELWEEAWSGGVRWPLRLIRRGAAAGGVPYTATWEWRKDGGGLDAESLLAAP